jgi:hypothetical protein
MSLGLHGLASGSWPGLQSSARDSSCAWFEYPLPFQKKKKKNPTTLVLIIHYIRALTLLLETGIFCLIISYWAQILLAGGKSSPLPPPASQSNKIDET